MIEKIVFFRKGELKIVNQSTKYKRVLLKLSGETFQGKTGYGIDTEMVLSIAQQIGEINNSGVGIAVCVGGGNIFRGVSKEAVQIDRSTADYMGMLATVINALALQDSLEKINIHSRVQTAIEMERLAEPYIRRRAIRHLEKERIVIFAAGTGNPFFSTDTAAALRAAEINAEAILKATKVDGIYSADPMKDKTAIRYDRLTYIEVLSKGLQIMDAPAISLCMENKIPIIVFNFLKEGNLKRVIMGEDIGTIVSS